MKKKRLFVWACLFGTFVPAALAEDIVLTAGNMEISAEGNATLTIDASGELSQYNIFQLDLSVPAGLSIAQRYNEDDEVWEDDVTSGIKKTKHNVSSNCTDGIYTFICTAGAEFVAFKTTSTNVLTINFTASADVINGTYPIVLSNIVFSDEEANRVVLGSIPGQCTITGGAEKATIPFSMSAAGWGTLILPFAADVPTGLKAYSCSNYEEKDGVNWLTLIAASSLAANTPYIMAGTAGNYEFEGTPNFTQTSYTNGLLTGVLVPTSIDHGYVLQKQSDEVAFFKVENGKSKTVPAYRCYLNDNPSGAIAFRMDDATGIEPCMLENEDEVIYDLQGRHCTVAPERGIYIRNGKLIMVK